MSPVKKADWSKAVTRHSHALNLREGLFCQRDPKAIARSRQAAAESSQQCKSDPYRAGKWLLREGRRALEVAKEALRGFYRGPRRH
ncbi:DUF3175 domain-containing protein [uncultured Microbulbifer sp.]|uniref:DUF3175 domain-containing protein n=1 Tax=uncultured Microbulbifer sp. TaxID=348147 RepID=UPI002626CAE9|nr:DUF3175 domain-containing protein [uncultured Microbulbifer sp.]